MDNTPPLSPEVKNLSDEDMIPEDEVDEIVDELLEARYSDDTPDSMSVNEDDSDNPMDDSMEEERDDAAYVFRGHSSGKKSL